MNHILENFIHHSWKQKSHTSQKCKVGPMDVTWLGSPPGGFSNLLAWLETCQQVSFSRVEGVKCSQELISSCEIPQREMAAHEEQDESLSHFRTWFCLSSKVLAWAPYCPAWASRGLSHIYFCGQGKGWALCLSWGRHEWQGRVPPHGERMEISTACLSSRARQEELYLSIKI